eukprot:3071265-Prymnesium_polylepis.1
MVTVPTAGREQSSQVKSSQVIWCGFWCGFTDRAMGRDVGDDAALSKDADIGEGELAALAKFQQMGRREAEERAGTGGMKGEVEGNILHTLCTMDCEG